MSAPRYTLARTTVITAQATIVATLVAIATAFASPAQALAPAIWDKVAACESSGNWAINTGNGFFGGLQFTTSTWAAFGGRAYAPQAHLASRAAQIDIADKVLAVQGSGAWPVCSIKAGMSRSSGSGNVARSEVRVAPRVQLAVNGRMDARTRAAMASRGISFKTRPVVKAWQVRLHVKVDGIAGPITTRALQRWLNTH